MPVVLVEKESPQISVVTLNRPERRNALTLELLTELCAAINIASEQPEQRGLTFPFDRRLAKVVALNAAISDEFSADEESGNQT